MSMPTKAEQFNTQHLKKIPELRPGDTVKVYQKIKEGSSAGEKERIQVFEGIIIAQKHGKGISGTITIRKVVEGVGVERIFPIHSPSLDKIEVVKSSKVRRSKLYYLREVKGKKSKLKKKEFIAAIAQDLPAETGEPKVSEEPVAPVAPEAEAKSVEIAK